MAIIVEIAFPRHSMPSRRNLDEIAQAIAEKTDGQRSVQVMGVPFPKEIGIFLLTSPRGLVSVFHTMPIDQDSLAKTIGKVLEETGWEQFPFYNLLISFHQVSEVVLESKFEQRLPTK